MADVGNWTRKSAGDPGIILRGPHVIVGRNEQVLEISMDGVQYDDIHTFPAGSAEFFPLDLPTDTYIRIVGNSVWAYAAYNQMSG